MLDPPAPPPPLCLPAQLDRHPRAPHLLAALMHKAGVAPELLPLLAEPARAAVQVRGWAQVK